MHRFSLKLVRDEAPAPYGSAVRLPGDVADIARALLADEAQEVVLVFHLDQRHNVRGYIEIARGGLAHAQVDTRTVFASALLANAAAIIVAHNHPSGDPTPSEDDRRLLVRLRDAGRVLDVEVLDHVVVAHDGHVSLAGQ